MNRPVVSTATVADGLRARLADHLGRSGLLPRGARVTVALSGGVDSVVLFDLLDSLRGEWGWTLSAAHFDHRMRPESHREAAWVEAFCSRRGVPCRIGRSRRTPKNEAEARRLRYDFLFAARRELDGDWLVTAHQADDQAETVLFRLRRGSGLAGLSGIPARRPPRIVRPLLPFWRAEIEAYAEERGLAHLDDPSNRDLSFTRNRLRHEIIPALVRAGYPALRTQLVRLGGLAGRATAAVDERVREAADAVVEEASEDQLVVARTRLLAYDEHVRAHLLRALAVRLGRRLSRKGTCVALEFIKTGSSGRSVDLAGDLVMRREFDRFVLTGPVEPVVPEDEELEVSGPGQGRGRARIAGRWWRVAWGGPGMEEPGEPAEWLARFDATEVRFPIRVRGWREGDRMRLAAGTRKLKKVFVDRKVGRWHRPRLPLLADRSGVLWIVGVERGVRAVPGNAGEALWVRVTPER